MLSNRTQPLSHFSGAGFPQNQLLASFGPDTLAEQRSQGSVLHRLAAERCADWGRSQGGESARLAARESWRFWREQLLLHDLEKQHPEGTTCSWSVALTLARGTSIAI